jgi:hypothetical protein
MRDGLPGRRGVRQGIVSVTLRVSAHASDSLVRRDNHSQWYLPRPALSYSDFLSCFLAITIS